MYKSLIVKLRNYFSDRIEEIKKGSYAPTYEQIKELPEFRGVNREIFRIARRKWYSQHFGITFRMFNEQTKRLGTVKARNISYNEYEKIYKKKIGICLSIIGGSIIVLLIWFRIASDPSLYMYGLIFYFILGTPFGIILLSIGIFLTLHNRSKASKI